MGTNKLKGKRRRSKRTHVCHEFYGLSSQTRCDVISSSDMTTGAHSERCLTGKGISLAP